MIQQVFRKLTPEFIKKVVTILMFYGQIIDMYL